MDESRSALHWGKFWEAIPCFWHELRLWWPFTRARKDIRQSKREDQGEIQLCLNTVRNLQGQVFLSQYALTRTPWLATLGRKTPKHGKTSTQNTQPASTPPAPTQRPVMVFCFFCFFGVGFPGGGDAFQGGWQFTVRDSRLHLTENVVSPLSFPSL